MALNIPDPLAFANWYGAHCGLRIVRHVLNASQTHFLADSDSTILEVYCNPSKNVPDYRKMDPLQLHLAFTSADPEVDARRLIDAGAEHIGEVRTQDGSHLIMLRDPWGIALQLCKRGRPLLV